MGADTIIIAMLFMVFGIVLGYGLGQRLGRACETNRRYWAYNALVVAVGILVSAIVSVFQLVTLASLAIGLIAGGIVGLKFGYGKSVGAWRRHDRAFRVNADQLKATQSAEEAAARGQSAAQAAERDLISVGPQAPSPFDKQIDPDEPATPRGGRAARRNRR
ncbi:hypothetical protein I3I95_06765 [bacterium]|nr:hypothetical protein [bacterium]